ncbi:group III truncated hemoglobin [uncultured Jannaschia sp.]|uniref:group III truncated hemoglobin n=1 Tax=uncultured Jannaschia sp. TaxID=293347 RepID=UPI00261FEA00|nr:group III truncated hemoglobin [uncultured Jannaschia sp.]
MSSPVPAPREVVTLRPEVTRALMDRTGLDDAVLTRLVHAFYDLARRDPLLGPIFTERISDWGPHLDRMVAFWSSVALMTGRYHGSPMRAHLFLPMEKAHFDRWLDLFSEAARETCPPPGAAHVIGRAERIAASIHGNIVDRRSSYGRSSTPPNPRLA